MPKYLPLSSLLCISTLSLSILTFSADQFPGVEKVMSAEEFEAAGLEKLSESEIKSLNQWLIRYTASNAPIVRRDVKATKEETNKDIRTYIDGEFAGWSGKTIFKLGNGQVWKQRLSGNWKTKLQNPEVVISRNFFWIS